MTVYFSKLESNGTPPETIMGKCARSTNVYMSDNRCGPLCSEWVHTMGFEKLGTKSSIIFQT